MSMDNEINDNIILSKYKNMFFITKDFGTESANLVIDIKKDITYNSYYDKSINYIIKYIEFREWFNNILPSSRITDDNTFSENDFNNIIFLSPIEFFNKYKDLFIQIYDNLICKPPKETDNEWYKNYYEQMKNVFESIPEIHLIVKTKKYNI